MNKCQKCGRLVGKNEHVCPDMVWNKNKKGVQVAWNKNKKLSIDHIENLKKAAKGRIPWNKGLTGKQIAWNKGLHINFNPNGSFKPGQTSGDKNVNWKGGITSIREKERKRTEIKFWRNSCFERDNFTCQKTGVRTGGLVVHHINNFSEYFELQDSIDNGITLSKSIHVKFHNKYGYTKNTKEQLNEFLNIS